MRRPRFHPLHWLLAFSLLLAGAPAQAQEDDRAYDAAVYLLTQTLQPYRDGRHNNLLLALRHLRDPNLAPLFESLIASSHAPQRVHGHLGLAEISPTGMLDLAAVAEIEDTNEIVGLLGAAVDSEVIATADLTQVLAWEGLDIASRQALAVHVVAADGAVDDALMRESLVTADDEPGTPAMLQHGLAALLLMQRGDTTALRELDKLAQLGPPETRDAVQAQLLEVALRYGFETIGPWALTLAQDDNADDKLRLVALRAALRFPATAEGRPAAQQWQAFWSETDDVAQRIRLALISLEAAPWASPDLYTPLLAESDTLLILIGQAGHAIATQDPNALDAVIRLVEHAHPMAVLWAINYANEHAFVSERAPILLAIMRGFNTGSERTRGRRTGFAIDAAQALAEFAPDALIAELERTLQGPAERTPRGELTLTHILLLGLIRAGDTDLSTIVAELPDLENRDAQDLVLMLRARFAATLDNAQWARIAQIVSGQTSLDDSLRIQLAWAYLEHTRRSTDAIREAAAQAR